MSRTESWRIVEDGCTKTAIIEVDDLERVLTSTQLARQFGLSNATDDAYTWDDLRVIHRATVWIPWAKFKAVLIAKGFAKVEEQS